MYIYTVIYIYIRSGFILPTAALLELGAQPRAERRRDMIAPSCPAGPAVHQTAVHKSLPFDDESVLFNCESVLFDCESVLFNDENVLLNN